MKYDIDIFYYMSIYKREWKRMVFLIIAAMVIVSIIQSMRPTTYRSTLIAVSSKESTNSARLGGINLTIGASSDDAIFSILKSRTMIEDVYKHYNLKNKPKFWWSLDTYVVTGGFAIEVTGSDPDMTEKIANYAAERVNEINKEKELILTTDPKMVKVLDPAVKGSPIKKLVAKKAIASGFFVFLVYFLFMFFKEYFSQLKRSRR